SNRIEGLRGVGLSAPILSLLDRKTIKKKRQCARDSPNAQPCTYEGIGVAVGKRAPRRPRPPPKLPSQAAHGYEVVPTGRLSRPAPLRKSSQGTLMRKATCPWGESAGSSEQPSKKWKRRVHSPDLSNLTGPISYVPEPVGFSAAVVPVLGRTCVSPRNP